MKYLIAVLSLSLLCWPSSAATIRVSPSGDDANSGGVGKPVRTLERARDLARILPGREKEDVVIVLDGAFRLDEPLRLGPEDSGANGHYIVYTGPGGKRAIISGARRVMGWKRVDAAKNLWTAPAPPGVTNSRQLYIDGVRAERASGRLPVALEPDATGYNADSPAMSGWRNPSDIEFVYTGGNSLWSYHSVGLGAWTEPRCPVGSISGSEITMAQPCWDNSTRRVRIAPEFHSNRTANLVGPSSVGKYPASVENAFELLTTPGQWYFDRPAAAIYYLPRPGEDLASADVEIPVLEKLVDGQGSPDHPLHHVIFRNLEFTGATWLYPSTSEGFSEIQANYMVTGPHGYEVQGLCQFAPPVANLSQEQSGRACPYGNWTKTPGNVSFSYDHQIQFRNCAFDHLGGAGLDLGDGSQSDLIQGCIFTDISANGLELGGVDLPEATGGHATADNQIIDNHICDVAAEYHGGIGICVGYARRTLIAHNQLDHLPYTGISMGWGGWPDKVKRAGEANTSGNNRVVDNLIFDHMLLLADGAAIYTQGLTGPSLQDGEKIEGNVIHDQFSTGHGIYTDNGCKNVTARGNVIFHVNHDNWGSRHHDYYDGQNGRNYDAFLFEGNYWQQGDRDSSRENVTLRDNHLIASLSDVPAKVLAAAGLEPGYRKLLEERFSAPAAPEPPKSVAVFAANGKAYVAWCPPVREGGAPVESYVVQCSAGPSATISAAEYYEKGYAIVTGVPNDQPCAFTVSARNKIGLGSPSLPSATVTPRAMDMQTPSAPRSVSAIFSNGKASVHFQAPEDRGGGPILGYVCAIEPGGRKVYFAGRGMLTLEGTHKTFAVVDGLSAGVSYRLEIAAINPAGEGERAVVKGSETP